MTGKRNLTAAIIGAGMIGEVHLRAARLAGAPIGGIVGLTPAGTLAAADRLGVSAYPRAEAAIDNRTVDVVDVCMPNATHYRLAMAALAAGQHDTNWRVDPDAGGAARAFADIGSH
ncbi:hypothetical protein WT83_16715 [Burkholderia territorii]|uniref:Gfo/Idh/MocA-like oxidoreductase N-terminal domain-containing protein n=1 Tax=Burkholderia territorii TaxID=1503055 RepID=A0A108ENX4_9BURK|nr:Gfo/Idh/MocA family oxidoreductase [Burkholderia territorii]KWN14726.1 hypothetical protein WT83_16715 [Burkholderia territorii]